MKTKVAQLKDLLTEVGPDQTADLLSAFSCPRNIDVESFLTKPDRAIRFEKTSNARTYLILDAEDGAILAYFAITFKELSIGGADLSKSEVQNIDGISRSVKGVRAYLIGQIGKNAATPQNRIKLGDILNEAYTVILDARELIGGRIAVLDCEDNERLIALYADHNFKLIEPASDDPRRLRTMYIHLADCQAS